MFYKTSVIKLPVIFSIVTFFYKYIAQLSNLLQIRRILLYSLNFRITTAMVTIGIA